MTPILYNPNETQFNNNGIGILSDAVSCIVTEERNGEYELELEYPVDGIHYQFIQPRCIILAKPNIQDDSQPFRIYRIEKPINGTVTVYAHHISYDLSGIPVSPFSAMTTTAALNGIVSHAATACPFSFSADFSTTATFTVAIPTSARSLLGGQAGSLLDVYGGEYKFDRYSVRLLRDRGENRGVSIRYGKNLTDLTQEENIQSVYTGVYPYFKDNDGNLVELDEKIVSAGTFDYTRIRTLDLSDKFEEAPTQEQLRSAAEAFITANRIGIPSVNLKVSFVQLDQTEEYKTLSLFDRVYLCDTVNVEFARLGVSATAKVIKTVYNVLLNRYDSIELGDAVSNIADTIASNAEEIRNRPNFSQLDAATERASRLITGNSGGYVVVHSSTNASKPDEILIMDTDDITTATKVWRWNQGGLGYSNSGYNGTYGTAITQDGEIVADFMTTGTLDALNVNVTNLDASNITAGTLYSVNYAYTGGTYADAGFMLDLPTGVIRSTTFAIDENGDSYFGGTLNAVNGTFTNLIGTDYIKLGALFIGDGYMQLINSNGRLDLQINANGTAQLSSDQKIFIGAWDGSGPKPTELWGSSIQIHCTDTGYNMLFDVPSTDEAALRPADAGKCNIGTNTYYFDYVHANHLVQHSLKKDKKKIRNLKESEYNIDAVRPVTYEVRDRDDGMRYIGLIAEELNESIPLAVAKTVDGEIFGIDYSRLAVVAIAEIQKIRKRLERLEK